MQNKINLGIIGKNFGYKVIYKSFLKNKKFKIVGFSFRKKKNTYIKLPESIKIYSNWKKLILDKKVNAVVIACPPKLHKNIIRFAIKNNKHIFCEKPFTTSSRDANFICNLVKKRKNISHMVNYEFPNIDAFDFFKKLMAKIKINQIKLDWIININKRSKTNWKEIHSKGGGIMFNYVCHAIYYLEFLFGQIKSLKSELFLEKESGLKNLKTKFFFDKNLLVKMNMKVGRLKKIRPAHQLKVISNNKTYILKTELNSLSDKFKLIAFNNKLKEKTTKILFNSKKNKSDFRILPTFKNSKKFSDWILKGNRQVPNFFNAKRVHLIINKMILSSKKNKKIYVKSATFSS